MKQLNFEETDYSAIEMWNSELLEEYSDSNLVFGFHTEFFSDIDPKNEENFTCD